MRQPTDPILKPKQMIHLRMPADLYQRLRELAAYPEEYNGITGIVVRAVREYVDRTYLGELSFTQWYVRTSKYHRRPSPMEKAITYAGRMPMESLGPREVTFFSATLRYHHDHDIWNAHTHALVARERDWLAAAGLRIPGDMPLSSWAEEDLPEIARHERSPVTPHE